MNIQTTLPDSEIKCELSQAYVHAVASRVGCRIQWSNRPLDSLGVDVHLRFEGDFPDLPDALNGVALDIQVKSTSQEIELDSAGRGIVFDGLTKSVYERFSHPRPPIPCFLVLFVLPDNPDDWLRLSEDELVLKKCAYWVSLKDGTPCLRDTKRIFFPQDQLFNMEQLKNIITTLATEGEFCYGN